MLRSEVRYWNAESRLTAPSDTGETGEWLNWMCFPLAVFSPLFSTYDDRTGSYIFNLSLPDSSKSQVQVQTFVCIFQQRHYWPSRLLFVQCLFFYAKYLKGAECKTKCLFSAHLTVSYLGNFRGIGMDLIDRTRAWKPHPLGMAPTHLRSTYKGC